MDNLRYDNIWIISSIMYIESCYDDIITNHDIISQKLPNYTYSIT